MKLSDIILEDDYWSKFKTEAQEIENEMKDTYNRDDISVSIIQHSNGDKAIGKVTIQAQEEVRPSEYQNMKSFLEAKGFEVTGGANFFDRDDDRYYYPDIKFEFKI
jgi:queuine/archaeosine tRNA-ribosyltransferase